MAEFRMPALGADMESGTLLEWRVHPGDAVRRGDIVAVVDTSKAEIEVEIFEDGIIDELLVSEGTRVPVGTVLATVRAAAGEATLEPKPALASPALAPVAAPVPAPAPAPAPVAAPVPRPAPPPAPAPAPAPPASAPAPAHPAPAAAPAPAPASAPSASPASVPSSAPTFQPVRAAPREHRLHVSPVARRMAERLGVDLSTVVGSGPDGAITKDDVERAAAGTPSPAASTPATAQPNVQSPAALAGAAAQPERERAVRQTAMREAIGALMARSKREIPHYYLQTQIDMTGAMAWLAEENLKRPVNERLLSAVLLLSAVARAAARTPAMNGFWIDGSFQAADRVHLGVAIALRGGGLVAPALHNAHEQSLDELMAGLRDLVARARGGRLRSSEMSDPTITVTDLGEGGVEVVHGVIYPPQVALVGFGGIRERPWAAGGMVGARPTVEATLAADHRVSDGHAGSRFLALIDRLLQAPQEL